ncbi:hypothetical protein BH24ACT25_BH24ACT25_10770 [soil metagenome]|jgi:uncharacterized membrane protein (DUF485 family)
MAREEASRGDGQTAQRPSASGHAEPFDRTSVDWEAAENSPEFKELIRKKKTFVLPATIFFFAWYFGYIILSGYAPEFMAESIYEGFTLGYAIALTQFIMVWVLSVWYVRKADRDFDPLARRAAEKAIESGRRATGPGGGSEVTAR